MKKKPVDPLSRIIASFENGEIVRVFFDLPHDVYQLLIDMASYYDLDIDEIVKQAILRHAEHLFENHPETRKTDTEISEIKAAIEKIMSIISELSSKVVSRPVVVQPATPARPSKARAIDIEVPDLQVVEGEEKEAEDRVDLDQAIEDVIVAAVAEDLLEEEK